METPKLQNFKTTKLRDYKSTEIQTYESKKIRYEKCTETETRKIRNENY